MILLNSGNDAHYSQLVYSNENNNINGNIQLDKIIKKVVANLNINKSQHNKYSNQNQEKTLKV